MYNGCIVIVNYNEIYKKFAMMNNYNVTIIHVPVYIPK